MHRGVIVNPRGCNASGKTTTAREFIKTFPEAKLVEINGAWVTQCSNAVFVLGRYDKKNGGCDGYKNREMVTNTIQTIIEQFSPAVIVYEGMLLSTSAKLAIDIDEAFGPQGYYYQGIYIHRPFDSILKLLEARNGGANYNPASIFGTYKANENAYRKLKQNGKRIVKIEADGIPMEGMGKLIWDVIPEAIREKIWTDQQRNGCENSSGTT